MQHIRKTHNVNRKTALSFSEKAYKDIIIKHTNPTDNYKWELKPHSNENINISNKHGKMVFQCPLLRCKSKLKHHSSVIDHLNRIHKIPRGKKMQDIVTHAQETFVESKELTNIHFSKKDNKEHIDKKRLIAIQESLAVETESKLQKYKELLAKTREGNMKDNKIFQSRNLQEHKRGVHTNKNKLLAINKSLAKNEFEIQKFKRLLAIKRRQEREGEIQKFKCQHCDEILKSAEELSTHIDSVHVVDKYACTYRIIVYE